MTAENKIFMGFTGVLMLCAIFVAGLVIQQKFFSSKRLPQKRQIKNWKSLKLTGQRTGSLDAPVQIVEFFDYQCPFCKSTQPAVKAILREYPYKVSVIYENFPLGGHQFALGAAIAAECARRQGIFMAYHDSLFANQARLGRLSYIRLAARIGVADTATFHRCVKNQATARTVKSGLVLGKKLKIVGIPTFIINGTVVTGELSIDGLDRLVQNALAEAGN